MAASSPPGGASPALLDACHLVSASYELSSGLTSPAALVLRGWTVCRHRQATGRDVLLHVFFPSKCPQASMIQLAYGTAQSPSQQPLSLVSPAVVFLSMK